MMRTLGISLLMLGLLAAGVDGFRVRERVRTAAPSTGTGAEGGVHSAENGRSCFLGRSVEMTFVPAAARVCACAGRG